MSKSFVLGLDLLLSQTIQLIGLVLGGIGAILLAIPFLKSRKQIEEESSTYIGFNPPLRKAMEREMWLTIAGLVFLLPGFVLQIIGVLLQNAGL